MQKAFTLIEIIIVIMMMGIFLGMGYSTYIKQYQSKDFDRQVELFVTTLELAKNKAVGRDISPNTACTTFDRYQVSVTQNTTPPQYNLQFVCTTPASTSTVQSYELTNMTASGLPTNPYLIQFHHPYGCTTDACNAATVTMRIRNPANATCKDVSINSLGNVTVGNLINGC